MRSLILTIVLFCLSFTVVARELTISEKIAIFSVESSNTIHEYMVDNIDEEALTTKEKIIFYVLKKSCYPINKELENIAAADDGEMPNRIAYVTAYAKACTEGVLSLTKLYIKYQ